MARPRKQEVDYFPHYCEHGKLLFILENHFKNDGYAVFYKLEEILAKTEGHCYDCSRLENWEYLLSKMLVSEDIVVSIIDKLTAMGVIDADLWKEKRIWMQSFVDSISDAYARRKVQLPDKPELMNTEIQLNGINDSIETQSKINKSKIKQNKENKNSKSDFVFSLPGWIPELIWKQFNEMRSKIKKPLTPYAAHLIIKELQKIKDTHHNDPVSVLEQSIRLNYQDVYPLKEANNANTSQGFSTNSYRRNNQDRGGLRPETEAELDRIAREYNEHQAKKAALCESEKIPGSNCG